MAAGAGKSRPVAASEEPSLAVDCDWPGALVESDCAALASAVLSLALSDLLAFLPLPFLPVLDADLRHAGHEPVGSLRDDDLAHGQSRFDDRLVAFGLADFEHPHFDVLVPRHHVGERAVGAALHRPGRNDQRVPLDLDQRLGVDELIRKQQVVLVREGGSQLHRASRRVDQVVDCRQLARSQLRSEIAVPRLDQHVLAALELLLHAVNVVLRNRVDHRDRLQLRDRGERRGSGRLD